MIEPLAPGEESRLLRRLSPNGTDEDYVEMRLTRVGKTQKIEFRQIRARGRRRSVFLTLQNFNEITELEAGQALP